LIGLIVTQPDRASVEDWHVPSQPGTPPPATRVLAFAPHPDDEVFGAGGVLALYAAAGAAVRVVIVTDGAAQVDAAERASYAAARMAESCAALACLAVHDLQCWGLRDRGLAADGTLPERIAQAIAEWSAEVVLAPSLWEIHPDHVAVGRAVLGAVRVTEPTPEVLLYEVGGAQRLNLLVDLAPVWAAKAQAMACFGTQQSRQNYARHIEALNVWRTYTLPPEVRHAEAFTHLRPADLRRMTVPGNEEQGGKACGATSDAPIAAFLQLTSGELLARADAAQESLRRQLQARDAALRASIDDFHRAMANRDAAVEALQHALRAREADFAQAEQRHEAHIEALQHALRAREADFAQAKQRHEAHIEALLGALDAMARSRSWRVTAPLRWVGSFLRSR
jgi:LmbE family N-acetylglucosaminyl deacetylase